MRMSTSTRIRLVASIIAAVAMGCSDSPVTPPGNGGDDSIPGSAVDTTGPVAVGDAVLFYSPAGNYASLWWTAPYDDSLTETVSRYEIRYSYTRGFEPPDFWDLSTIVSDPPSPVAPGTMQRYVFYDAQRGKDLYVGVLSYDEKDNRSSRGNIPTVHIPGSALSGVCVNPLTRARVPGLQVQVSAGPVFTLTTDENGRFRQEGLQPGAVSVEIATGTSPVVYHRLVTQFVLSGDSTVNFTMIPFERPLSPIFSHLSLLGLFKEATLTGGAQTILAKYHKSPLPVHIPPLVNENGVDYREQAIAAAERWMERTGLAIFEFVDARPDTGVYFTYHSRQTMEPLLAITRHTTGQDLHPICDEIQVVNDFTNPHTLYKIMMHELGHTIRFTHIGDSEFIMYGGQPLPEDISEDEKNLTILHQSLPTRVDMNSYDARISP